MDRVPKRVKMPWRPILGYAEGQVVQAGQGDYWRIDRATIEGTGHSSNVYLYLSPLNPGEVLNGFGELVPDRIVQLPVTRRENLIPNPSMATDARGWAGVGSGFVSLADDDSHRLVILAQGDAGDGARAVLGEPVYAGVAYYGQLSASANYAGDVLALTLGTGTDVATALAVSSLDTESIAVQWIPRQDHDRAWLSLVTRTALPNTFFVDAVSVSRLEGGYVDGSMAGMAWLGEPNLSVSREV